MNVCDECIALNEQLKDTVSSSEIGSGDQTIIDSAKNAAMDIENRIYDEFKCHRSPLRSSAEVRDSLEAVREHYFIYNAFNPLRMEIENYVNGWVHYENDNPEDRFQTFMESYCDSQLSVMKAVVEDFSQYGVVVNLTEVAEAEQYANEDSWPDLNVFGEELELASPYAHW